MGENNIKWQKGICGICPAGCWIEAGIKEGKLVDIKADKTHPLGMLCRRGEHAPEIIYSEHRLKYPQKRTGPKGTYEFERISWDEAYDIIGENLNRLKKDHGPESVSIYTGRGTFELSLCDLFKPKDTPVSSASNLLFPFGSPNTMGVGALCYVSFAMIAPHVTMGRMLINMFTDIENSSLIIVWGANPATDSPPLDMYRLENAVKKGAEVITIDPRKTETAERTGAEWVPIRPGTDGALALAMIREMIEEDLYDENFVENWTHGFDELKRYAQHFTPEKTEKITGVPAAKIREITRKICKAESSCPVMYTGLEYSNTGLQAVRAVLTLFACAGHLDMPGGIGLAMEGSSFPLNQECNQANPDLDKAIARDKFPLYSKYRGESHAIGLVDSVLKGEPYKIRGLIIHGGSILTSWPQTSRWRETLSELDFLVTIDRQLTADSAYADIVLPATTMFEIESYMTYGPIFRLREKLIEPVGEARNDYLIMQGIAEKLGYGNLYPKTEKEVVDYVLKGSGYTAESIHEAGGYIQKESPVMEYKKWEKGKLRKDGKPGFDTPTGKFEIWSTVLEDYGYSPLPEYTEVTEGPLAAPDLARKYPLVFNSGARPQTDFRSQHHGIKGLVKDNPEPTVDINVEDAKERGIKTGDLVSVETGRGSVPFRARVTGNIVKGSVDCSMGGGTPAGPEAWQKWNVNELTDLNNYDKISGFPVYKALLCEVKKLEEATEDSIKSAGFRATMPDPVVNPDHRTNVRKKIYLDNNATSGVHPEVFAAMEPFLKGEYGNPSSIHTPGKHARESVEDARRSVASLLGARPGTICFTGGGSEADNLAIKGTAFAEWNNKKHIITTTVEHPAVLKTCRFLEKIGYKVTYLPVNEYGSVTPAGLREALTEDTFLVTIMTANNEVGTIQPIKELCSIAHGAGALFHTDAVQAAGKIKIDVSDTDVDMLSISAHKFHGPKGIGALYVKKGITLEPVIHGGKQERGIRAGTENVPGIIGMGKAADIARREFKKVDKMRILRDKLERELKKAVPELYVNGDTNNRLPNTSNMILPKYRGESLVVALNRKGIYISSGSACKAGSPDPTHVLLAMGKTPEEAHCSVRFSLDNSTTEIEIDRTVTAFKEIIKEMESTIRFLPCK